MGICCLGAPLAHVDGDVNNEFEDDDENDEVEVSVNGRKEVVVNRRKVVVEVCIPPVCCITVVNARMSRMYSMN